MVAEDFIMAKQQSWRELAALTSRAQTNITALSAADLQELGRLYRRATSDLAQARRDYPGHPVTMYLNDLVAQGHSAIYREKIASVSGIKHYFAVALPQAFRRTLPFILLALLFFVVPMAVGWVLAALEPERGVKLMPELAAVVDQVRQGNEWWLDINNDNAGSSIFILTNNIYVSLWAFVGGLLIGIPTIYTLYKNGLMLGVISGAAQAMDFDDRLWGFVFAHAVVELSIIVFSGGAGLRIGWAMVRPGMLSRRAALVNAAHDAFVLAGAIVIFLVMAGIIEGYVSPSGLPFAIKAAVGLISGAIMYAYLFLAGRETGEQRSENDVALVIEQPKAAL